MRTDGRALALAGLTACGGMDGGPVTSAATIGGNDSTGVSTATSQGEGSSSPDGGVSSLGSTSEAGDASDTGQSQVMPTPFALSVDADGNRVLEPGESITVAPSWIDASGAAIEIGASLSEFLGTDGPTYQIVDAAALYPFGGADPVACGDDCYELQITAAMRPEPHWDATVHEALDIRQPHDWILHVGPSFTDVPTTSGTYRAIETLLHHGVTNGCDVGLFCPTDTTLRIQVAVFVARAMTLDSGGVPRSGTVAGVGDYDCDGGVSLFDDVPTTDPFCAEAHHLFAEGITSGCGGAPPLFCPLAETQRQHIAVFVAGALNGGAANVPQMYADPVTGLAYDCSPASPDLAFVDVAADDPWCAAVHYVWARGITVGCGGDQFCPMNPATREQSALFVVEGFELALYRP